MAPSNKLNVSTGPAIQRISAKERHAARVAEVANKQRELKQEAAQRRAKREFGEDPAAAEVRDPKVVESYRG